MVRPQMLLILGLTVFFDNPVRNWSTLLPCLWCRPARNRWRRLSMFWSISPMSISNFGLHFMGTPPPSLLLIFITTYLL